VNDFRKAPLNIGLAGGGSLPDPEGYGKTQAPFTRTIHVNTFKP